MTLIITIVIIALIAFFVFAPNQSNEKNNKSYSQYKYKQKALMTDNEFDFFNRLNQALPDYHVFPQVSMGAILQGDGPNKFASRGTFAQKIIDYVIYNKQKRIIAIVELDDKTHDQDKDEKRDAMLIQAGYRIVRYNSKNKPSIEEIKKDIG
jgi:hypothetical protein